MEFIIIPFLMIVVPLVVLLAALVTSRASTILAIVMLALPLIAVVALADMQRTYLRPQLGKVKLAMEQLELFAASGARRL